MVLRELLRRSQKRLDSVPALDGAVNGANRLFLERAGTARERWGWRERGWTSLILRVGGRQTGWVGAVYALTLSVTPKAGAASAQRPMHASAKMLSCGTQHPPTLFPSLQVWGFAASRSKSNASNLALTRGLNLIMTYAAAIRALNTSADIPKQKETLEHLWCLQPYSDSQLWRSL